MAIDTRNERASIVGYALPLGVYPNPDGTLDQADRQQVALMYPGILASALMLASGQVTVQITSARPAPGMVAQSPRVGFVGMRPEPTFTVED